MVPNKKDERRRRKKILLFSLSLIDQKTSNERERENTIYFLSLSRLLIRLEIDLEYFDGKIIERNEYSIEESLFEYMCSKT